DKYIQEIIRTIPDVIRGIEIVDIEQKSGERDLVTEVDKGVEEFLRKKILDEFPDHEVMGEETYDTSLEYNTKNLWVIDPIDGTANFVKQRNDFCTIVSYFEDGEPMLTYIYEVTKDDLYHGMSGEGVYLNGEKLPKIENKS
ncbi:MAG: inositol monophosphatase family protein, partial [Neofamilia sp.]